MTPCMSYCFLTFFSSSHVFGNNYFLIGLHKLFFEVFSKVLDDVFTGKTRYLLYCLKENNLERLKNFI